MHRCPPRRWREHSIVKLDSIKKRFDGSSSSRFSFLAPQWGPPRDILNVISNGGEAGAEKSLPYYSFCLCLVEVRFLAERQFVESQAFLARNDRRLLRAVGARVALRLQWKPRAGQLPFQGRREPWGWGGDDIHEICFLTLSYRTERQRRECIPLVKRLCEVQKTNFRDGDGR